MRKLLLALGLALWAGPALAVVTTTIMPNAAYTGLITDQRIITSAAFTAPRTLTLPAAGGTCIGQTCPPFSLEFYDAAGTLTSTNTLTVAPATGDTINGSATSLVFASPNVKIIMVPISGTNWLVVATVNGGGVNPGSSTGDNACTGCIGEFVSSITGPAASASAAPVNGAVTTSSPLLTTTAAANVTQVLLTPGDWDCRAEVTLAAQGSGAVTTFSAWTSTANQGSIPNNTLGFSLNHSYASLQAASVTSPAWALTPQSTRYSFSSTTSVFLNAVATFSAGTVGATGDLDCRRAR
jgi:Bacteriophage T4 gp9/10-like protein